MFWSQWSWCVGAFSAHLQKETMFHNRVSPKAAQGIFAMESLGEIVKKEESCVSSTCIELESLRKDRNLHFEQGLLVILIHAHV